MPRVLFTKETAAAMARKSHAPGSARFKPFILPPSQLPQPIPQPASTPATSPPAPPQDFISTRLSRVRAQLDRLDQLLSIATDTKAIKELADATKRLQDQERELSGRPLPGSRRPAPEPSPSARPAPRPPAAPIARQPSISPPLPKVDQPSTTPSVAPDDEPDGIEYGPID